MSRAVREYEGTSRRLSQRRKWSSVSDSGIGPVGMDVGWMTLRRLMIRLLQGHGSNGRVGVALQGQVGAHVARCVGPWCRESSVVVVRGAVKRKVIS
ncbi:hypothetical protein Pcinc_000498 [Petrolisthes cinctipes]|uniref:Uncharacterized protein n=1 Tax=Petrolisthes cinctipes TaxID=88211 RepID=A0AAE1GNC2_PETCI|nr:hypothetical protein Pcinc_000498 [Petrolisthes cinctipes]